MNTSTVAEPRTAAALVARRSSTRAALGRVHDAISWLRREKTPISVAAVGRRAGVSRTFLYAAFGQMISTRHRLHACMPPGRSMEASSTLDPCY